MIEWLRGLIQELKIEGTVPIGPTPMHADNQAAIGMAEQQKFSKRTKHIAIHHHYVKELVEKGDIKMVYVPTSETIADTMTKPFGRLRFEAFVAGIGMKRAFGSTRAGGQLVRKKISKRRYEVLFHHGKALMYWRCLLLPWSLQKPQVKWRDTHRTLCLGAADDVSSNGSTSTSSPGLESIST